MPQTCIHIVDDEDVMLTSVTMMLRVLGYSAKQWSSSADFVETAELADGDLVLTDLRMPEYDGFEVHRRIVESGRDTPFILMTGHGTLETAKEAQSRGFCAALLKPFTMADLASAVECATAQLYHSRLAKVA